MILKVYSIRDAKAEIFNPPFYKHTHGEAERDFKKITNDPKSFVNQFPEDFDLYYLGLFDDNTGKFQPLDTPEHQLKAIMLKESAPQLSSIN